MKLLLQLATALLLLAASDAKTTPAVCKNKTCVTASGDTCDRSTSTSCGACMSVSDSGTVSCKDTNFFGLCSSSTKCGAWSSSSSGSGSGTGSGTGNTTTTAPVSTTESPQSPQPTQPTQPPQPTQPTQRPSDQTTTPAPTDDASSATAEPTAAPATSPPSSTNWALYGGIGGGVVGLFLIIGIACCIIRKRRNEEDDDDDVGHYANKAQSTPPAQVAIPMTTMSTHPTPAPPMYAVPEPAPVFALPISPRSSSSNTSLPRTSAMSGYEVATNPLVNFVARASVETDTAPYRQTIAQKFNHLENFNEGVGSDSESDSSSFHRQRTSTDGSFNMSDGSNDSFVVTRTEDDRKDNGTACSVEF